MSLLYPQALLLLLALFWLHQQKLNKALLGTLFLLILALSRPIMIEKQQDQKLQAKEVIIALDVSYSMRAQDIQPNRLDQAQKSIQALATANKQDSFALFAFTTNPLILTPFTTDHTLLIAALDSLKVENILTHGTNFHSLLSRISALQTPYKSLLIFSDGGEFDEITPLLEICKQQHITIHAIATATNKGTYLLDDSGKKMKDSNKHLIITHLNPNLKRLALQSGGTFHTLDELDTDLDFIDSAYLANKKQTGYNELFWIPTLLALILFLLQAIQIPKKILLLFPFLTTFLQAGLLDWYHIQHASKAYHDSNYTQAIKHFSAITNPSIASQLNLANSYYQAGHFTEAKSIYSTLQTTHPYYKKIILFKLANCAVQTKEYDKARDLYLQALRFGKDQNIIDNLHLIEKKRSQQRRDFAAVQSNDKARDDAPKGDSKQQKEKKSGQSKGAGEGKGIATKGKTTQQNSTSPSTKKGTLAHPLGYKAYELINKGYLDEKTPW